MDNDKRIAARNYFKECELTYDDITESDIAVLVLLLNKNIKKACRENRMSCNTMHMSKRIDIKKKSNGVIKSAYTFINSHYFNLTREKSATF
jgi:hypothetical protein